MNANELRIGNLVLFDGVVHKIEVIDGYASFVYFEEFGDNEFPLNKIEPIPLTEEWLLKFGFRKKTTDYIEQYFKDNYFIEDLTVIPISHSFVFRKEIDKRFSALIADLIYVHQLQNLYFALTGTELQLTTK